MRRNDLRICDLNLFYYTLQSVTEKFCCSHFCSRKAFTILLSRNHKISSGFCVQSTLRGNIITANFLNTASTCWFQWFSSKVLISLNRFPKVELFIVIEFVRSWWKVKIKLFIERRNRMTFIFNWIKKKLLANTYFVYFHLFNSKTWIEWGYNFIEFFFLSLHVKWDVDVLIRNYLSVHFPHCR